MRVKIEVNNKNTTITDFGEIELRLKELGISSNVLIEACKSGVLSRSNSTAFDTKGQPGYIQWNDTNSKLRLLTHNQGWEVYQENGIEGIISKDKKIRIIPSSGNAATGNPNQPASNKNPKGEGSIKLIDKGKQGNIFTGFPEQDVEEFETYILLYYANDKELRMELSKPSFIDTHGKIKAWEERLILPKQSLNDIEIMPEETNEDEIDIPVIRKQNRG